MTEETPEEPTTEPVPEPVVPQASVPTSTGISATELLLQQNAKEHKKSVIFMIASGVLAFTTVGAFVFGLSVGSDNNNNHRPPAFMKGPGGRNFLGGRNGGPGGAGGPAAGAGLKARFFGSDGTVDQSKVTQFLNRLSPANKTNALNLFNNQITKAVNTGKLTTDQAAALRNALGITAPSS